MTDIFGFGGAVGKVGFRVGVALMVLIEGRAIEAYGTPVAYWSFDQDFSASEGGSSFDGIPTGGVVIDSGMSRFGGASARFDRSTHGYVRIPASPFTGANYTYAAWYYFDVEEIEGEDRFMVIEASDGASFPASYGLRRLNGVQVGQCFLNLGAPSLGTPNISIFSGSHREWRHVVVTYDGEIGRLDIFLDGKPAGSRLAPENSTALAGSTFLHIGGHRGGGERNWEGWIDAVAVWDRVLTRQEILLLQRVPPTLLDRHGFSGYRHWLARSGLPENLGRRRMVARGDGGLLLRYASDMQSMERRPLTIAQGEDENGRYWVLDLHKNPYATGLSYAIERSSDLKIWSLADVAIVEETPGLRRMRVLEIPHAGEPTNESK